MLSLDVPYNIEPSGTVNVAAAVGSSTMVGDLYTHQATIAPGGVTANSDGTVTLTFVTSDEQPIAKVTVPEPQNGTYKDGDEFSFKKCNVTGISAKAGANCINGIITASKTHTIFFKATSYLNKTSIFLSVS